jgi:hypothetical protein
MGDKAKMRERKLRNWQGALKQTGEKKPSKDWVYLNYNSSVCVWREQYH